MCCGDPRERPPGQVPQLLVGGFERGISEVDRTAHAPIIGLGSRDRQPGHPRCPVHAAACEGPEGYSTPLSTPQGGRRITEGIVRMRQVCDFRRSVTRRHASPRLDTVGVVGSKPIAPTRKARKSKRVAVLRSHDPFSFCRRSTTLSHHYDDPWHPSTGCSVRQSRAGPTPACSATRSLVAGAGAVCVSACM